MRSVLPSVLPVRLLLAAVIGACLSGAPTAVATAADPYPGTVVTSCTVDLDASAEDRRLSAAIDVLATSSMPMQGTLVAVFAGPGGGELATVQRDYQGGRLVIEGPRAKDKGRYLANVSFTPRSGSVFTRCDDEDGVDVGVGGTDDETDDDDPGTDPQAGQADNGDGVLPNTGGQPLWVLPVGGALLVVGAGLVIRNRRRPELD